MEEQLSPLIQAVISLLSGGVAVAIIKLIEKVVLKRKDFITEREQRIYRESAVIREELRKDISKLEKRVIDLTENLEECKKNYWELYEEYMRLRVEKLEETETEAKEKLENRINGNGISNNEE